MVSTQDCRLPTSRGLLPVLLLLVALLPSTVAQNQCFTAPNIRAGSAIVPCASTSSGPAACCQIGDLCLSDNACWNPPYNVTYLYGCTDSTYTSYVCPYKCGSTFANGPYVGLDYCMNTTTNEWSCTHPPTNAAGQIDDNIEAFRAQQCLDDSIIAFAGPSSLIPILSLPTSVGGSTEYFSPSAGSYILVSGYTPTSTYVPIESIPSSAELVGSTSNTDNSAAPDSNLGSSTVPVPIATTVQVTVTATPSSSSMPASSTSTVASPFTTSPSLASSAAASASPSSTSTPSNSGSKIGIGVGVGVGVPTLAGIAIGFLIWRRRKNRHAAIPQHDVDETGAYGAQERKAQPTHHDDDVWAPQREPAELSAHKRSMRKSNLSDQASRSSARSPVPVYQEFEGSPVPDRLSGVGTGLGTGAAAGTGPGPGTGPGTGSDTVHEIGPSH